MSSAHLRIVLAVAAVTLMAVTALHRVGVESAVVLVLAGLVVGFLPFVPDVSLSPEVALLGLLPLLVFDAAATSSLTSFARSARPIGLLAVGLVLLTAAAVAAAAHWVEPTTSIDGSSTRSRSQRPATPTANPSVAPMAAE